MEDSSSSSHQHCGDCILNLSTALLTARAFQKRSRPQQLTLCRSLHAEALQATASEGLAQVSYVAARAGFKPTTLLSKGIDSTMSHVYLCDRTNRYTLATQQM